MKDEPALEAAITFKQGKWGLLVVDVFFFGAQQLSSCFQCRPAHWLGVVHYYNTFEGGWVIYTHHFVQLHRTANKTFTIDWISEPWRRAV